MFVSIRLFSQYVAKHLLLSSSVTKTTEVRVKFREKLFLQLLRPDGTDLLHTAPETHVSAHIKVNDRSDGVVHGQELSRIFTRCQKTHSIQALRGYS